jgi:hypothetical protein
VSIRGMCLIDFTRSVTCPAQPPRPCALRRDLCVSPHVAGTQFGCWRPEYPREPLLPPAVADLPAAGGGIGGSVDPQIMAALMRLPARQRQVVALRLFLDLDISRTAEVLGIAPGTVQSHQGRAIAALRGDLMAGRPQENPA